MIAYLVKRTITAVVTLFFVIALTFFIMQMVPGGPYLGENLNPEIERQLNQRYGFDKPVMEQFGLYLKNLFRGDLGVSIVEKQGTPVTQVIAAHFPASLRVGLLALLLSAAVGIPLGMFSALKRGGALDKTAQFLTSFATSVPSFILTVLLMLLFGVYWRLVPFIGLTSPASYVLPVAGLSIYQIGYIARLMRSTMLDVLSADYIKTARAKGLSWKKVLFKHALRNAVLPIVTYMGPLIAGILTGSFVIEKVFSIPGLGKFFISSISSRDYPLIMGTTIFYGALLILCNLLVDAVNCLIDPRLRHSK